MIGKFTRFAISCSSWSIQGNTTTAMQRFQYYEQRLRQKKKESIQINPYIWNLQRLKIEEKVSKAKDSVEEGEYQVEAYRRNQVDGRILHKQFSANSPIEDHMCFQQLTTVEGYLMAVFDGHGGNTLARFSSENIVGCFEDAFNKRKQVATNDPFVGALSEAYSLLQKRCQQVIRGEIEKGNRRAKNLGTCALTVIVSNNIIYVANAGDSEGVLIEMDRQHIQSKCLNEKFNTSNKNQQQRLRRQFPSQQDILVQGKSCPALYIKGRLQTTRAIGDFYLKKQQFNTSPKIKNFNGPYITCQPDIKTFEIGPNSKYLVLGSDGLWDELSQYEVAKLIMTNDKQDKAQILLEECFRKIAKRNGMTAEEVQGLPEKQKRNFHDDISVMVVDLQQQYAA